MQKLKSKAGFSFVEVVITLFIIGVILTLYVAAVNTMHLAKTVKHQELALRVANNKMEELRAGGYLNLPSSGSFSDSQLSALPSSSASMTITDYNTSTKQVLVNIQWKENGSSAFRNIGLTTLITKVGGL